MDFFKEEGVFGKAKSIIFSSLNGTLWWTSTSLSPMQTPKHCSSHPPGLKALIYSSSTTLSEEQPQNPTPHHPGSTIHSFMIAPPPPTPPPSSSSSNSPLIDDLIGTESGVCMNSNVEELTNSTSKKPEPYYRRSQTCETKKKFPPAISLLARTGNLPGYMPWVLSREYVDGRLILKEQKVRRYEYFEARRENGRLILKLVPLDDTAGSCHVEEEQEIEDVDYLEEEEEEEESEGDSCVDYVKNEIMQEKLAVKIPVSYVSKSCLENASERFGDARKCFTYAGACMSRSASISFPSLAARPVTTVV